MLDRLGAVLGLCGDVLGEDLPETATPLAMPGGGAGAAAAAAAGPTLYAARAAEALAGDPVACDLLAALEEQMAAAQRAMPEHFAAALAACDPLLLHMLRCPEP